MALTNPETNEYYKLLILNEQVLKFVQIDFAVYRDEEARGDESVYTKAQHKTLTVMDGTLADYIATHSYAGASDDHIDKYKTLIYEYVKLLDEYKNYEDC